MKISNKKRIEKGVMVCSFDVEFERFGLTIRDCIWCEKGTSYWINWPSRRYEQNGEVKYYRYISWTHDREKQIVMQVKELLENTDYAHLEKEQKVSNEQKTFEEIPF